MDGQKSEVSGKDREADWTEDTLEMVNGEFDWLRDPGTMAVMWTRLEKRASHGIPTINGERTCRASSDPTA